MDTGLNPGLAKIIAVAKGDEPADLVLANGKIVNTLTADIEDGDVAIYQERIAGIGRYKNGRETIDLGSRYVAPGLIDGHVHIESSLLHPAEYARTVVPRGVSAIVTDLHEIANVSGLNGINYMMNIAEGLPLDFYYMAPSCVPATHLETSGAALGPEDIKIMLGWKNVLGLGELMNFPGVLGLDTEVLRKLEYSGDEPIDGHAPSLTGKDLNAYIAAGAGSDHECTRLAEGAEKLRRGMYLMIREGSSEKNLEELLPLVTDATYRRCLFVVDDRTCADLLRDGEIDAVVRKAISNGLNPLRALQLATINTAERFGLHRTGAVAPGYLANLVVIDDLFKFKVDMVFHNGRLVASDGELLAPVARRVDPEIARTVRIKPFGIEALRLPARSEPLPLIGVVPGQIVTRKVEAPAKIENGFIVPDTERDILKCVVVERHKGTGNIGTGLVTGFGLKSGALASSIAHDCHNIIVIGTNDQDIYACIKDIQSMQGGLVVRNGDKVITLALPIAGLLSEEPLESVVMRLEALERAARELGCTLSSPFATLSFLALPVIPEIRLTDRGLVDVAAFELIK